MNREIRRSKGLFAEEMRRRQSVVHRAYPDATWEQTKDFIIVTGGMPVGAFDQLTDFFARTGTPIVAVIEDYEGIMDALAQESDGIEAELARRKASELAPPA